MSLHIYLCVTPPSCNYPLKTTRTQIWMGTSEKYWWKLKCRGESQRKTSIRTENVKSWRPAKTVEPRRITVYFFIYELAQNINQLSALSRFCSLFWGAKSMKDEAGVSNDNVRLRTGCDGKIEKSRNSAWTVEHRKITASFFYIRNSVETDSSLVWCFVSK